MTTLSALRDFSQCIGTRPLWIQGPGGNTSLKINDTLWVKSSGTWLANAHEEHAFVPLALAPARDQLRLVPTTTSPKRPSIEALLHALMPHPVVCHTHSIVALSYLVRTDAQAMLSALLKDMDWVYIPYQKPGEALACALRAALTPRTQIVMLENHGVVVGAEDTQGALALLEKIDAALARPLRARCLPPAPGLAQSIRVRPDFTVPEDPLCHFVAQDALAYHWIQQRSLYPDHAVFLHDKIHPFPGKAHSQVLLCPQQGVLVHEDFSSAGMQMLKAFSELARRLYPRDPLKTLSPAEEHAVCHWEAEDYRRAQNQASAAI